MSAVDPLLGRAVRLARVARRTHVLSELHPTRLPALLRVALRRGIDVRSLFPLWAVNEPAAIALVDARARYTYAEANRVVEALAAVFRRGESIAIALENRAEYVLVWFAAMRAGARAVHVGTRLVARELAQLVSDAGVRTVFTSDDALATVREVARERSDLRVVVMRETAASQGECSWDTFLDRVSSSEAPPSTKGNSESVVYTSGTTGKPKGAVRDFTRFGVLEFTRLLDRLPFRFGDKHLVVAPLHHSAAQAFALIHLALGGTLFLESRFDPCATVMTLSREAIASVFVVPTMLRRILELPPQRFAENPLPSLRAIVAGAGELDPALRDAAIDRFGARRVFEFYGATEIGWVTLIDGEEMRRKPGSAGRALPGQRIVIRDRDGRELAAGKIGLVHVENEQAMEGYLGDDESRRSRRSLTVEDLGRLDDDGYLYVVGRARDMVKTGGINVYPAEIEGVLAQAPTVREVSVVGMPDPEWGERLVCAVVPSDGGFDRAAVEQFARAHLSAYKIPKEWKVMSSFPRNALGKIDKRVLRAQLRQEREEPRRR